MPYIESNKSFPPLLSQLHRMMQNNSNKIHTEKWQGLDISNRPEAEMHELTNIVIHCNMPGEELEVYRKELTPNLPWVDEHFVERVGGNPVNPGLTWKSWPWALNADKARRFDGKFSHTYMERYWPRFTGQSINRGFQVEMQGHWFRYGDLEDIISLLRKEPLSRQAYLPIFFPEDTGAHHGDRVPCTLGYHWLLRDHKLHTFYPIRSCDYYRHFRDDIYLTARLTLWILKQLRARDLFWESVSPGNFTMWIGSLHMFRNDYIKLFKAQP